MSIRATLTLAAVGLLAVSVPALATPLAASPTPAPAPAPASNDELPEDAFVAFDTIANHYKCYSVQPLVNQQFPPVVLSDQFKQSNARVIRPVYLCNPTRKNTTGIIDPDLHYVCFEIIQDFDPPLPDVVTSNQFGDQFLRPIDGELLCLPSKKVHL